MYSSVIAGYFNSKAFNKIPIMFFSEVQVKLRKDLPLSLTDFWAMLDNLQQQTNVSIMYKDGHHVLIATDLSVISRCDELIAQFFCERHIQYRSISPEEKEDKDVVEVFNQPDVYEALRHEHQVTESGGAENVDSPHQKTDVVLKDMDQMTKVSPFTLEDDEKTTPHLSAVGEICSAGEKNLAKQKDKEDCYSDEKMHIKSSQLSTNEVSPMLRGATSREFFQGSLDSSGGDQDNEVKFNGTEAALDEENTITVDGTIWLYISKVHRHRLEKFSKRYKVGFKKHDVLGTDISTIILLSLVPGAEIPAAKKEITLLIEEVTVSCYIEYYQSVPKISQRIRKEAIETVNFMYSSVLARNDPNDEKCIMFVGVEQKAREAKEEFMSLAGISSLGRGQKKHRSHGKSSNRSKGEFSSVLNRTNTSSDDDYEGDNRDKLFSFRATSPSFLSLQRGDADSTGKLHISDGGKKDNNEQTTAKQSDQKSVMSNQGDKSGVTGSHDLLTVTKVADQQITSKLGGQPTLANSDGRQNVTDADDQASLSTSTPDSLLFGESTKCDYSQDDTAQRPLLPELLATRPENINQPKEMVVHDIFDWQDESNNAPENQVLNDLDTPDEASQQVEELNPNLFPNRNTLNQLSLSQQLKNELGHDIGLLDHSPFSSISPEDSANPQEPAVGSGNLVDTDDNARSFRQSEKPHLKTDEVDETRVVTALNLENQADGEMSLENKNGTAL